MRRPLSQAREGMILLNVLVIVAIAAAAVAVTYPVGTPDVKVDAAIRALLEVSDKVAAKMYRNRKK